MKDLKWVSVRNNTLKVGDLFLGKYPVRALSKKVFEIKYNTHCKDFPNRMLHAGKYVKAGIDIN